MILLSLALGILALYFGGLLLFGHKKFAKADEKMNKIVFDTSKFMQYRVSLGLLLVGMSAYLFIGAYFYIKYLPR